MTIIKGANFFRVAFQAEAILGPASGVVSDDTVRFVMEMLRNVHSRGRPDTSWLIRNPVAARVA